MEKYSKEYEKLVCDAYLELKTVSKVSKKLGVCREYVARMLQAYGIRKKPDCRIPITKEIENNIINDYTNSNLTEDEIAEKYNIVKTSVRNVWKRNNISVREKVQSKTLIENMMKCDDNYFENINTPEQSWVLGFVTGDGSLGINYTLKFGLSIKDLSVLEKIKRFMKADQDIQKGMVYLNTTDKYYEHCFLVICRKKIYKDLINLGITPEKSFKLKLPPIPENLIAHFLRGLVCSDGCFHIDDDNCIHFMLACPVYDILEEFQDILIKKYNFTDTEIPFDKGCFRLKYAGNFQVRKIFEYLYPDDMGDAYLNRKYNYCKQHFYNLDHGIKSRNKGEPALEQYSFTTDLKDLPILKSYEISHHYHINGKETIPIEPKPRTQLEILLGLNK